MGDNPSTTGQHVKSHLASWKPMGIVFAFFTLLGATGTIYSFYSSNVYAGYFALSATILVVVVSAAPRTISYFRTVYRASQLLLRLERTVPPEILDELEVRAVNSQDAFRLLAARSEIFEVCDKFDRLIMDLIPFREDPGIKAWTGHAMGKLLPRIAGAFRKFTNQPSGITAQLIGRDNKDPNRLRVVWSDATEARKKSQPNTFPAKGSIPEKVLEEGKGQICSEASDLSVDDGWKDRKRFVNSFIAWPVFLNERAHFVLKIDSTKPGEFRDSEATELLADLCSRKVSAILSIGRAFDPAVQTEEPAKDQALLDSNLQTEHSATEVKLGEEN